MLVHGRTRSVAARATRDYTKRCASKTRSGRCGDSLNPLLTVRPWCTWYASIRRGYDGVLANERIGDGHADAVIFGRPFIANPDLPSRLTNGWPLAESDPSLWYSANEATRANPDKGYTDYPYYSA